ncbi:lanthionine synthetase LanC family protein [Fulvivirga sediminis]|uniref:Lanthionine synthetase C family protein n=1 Tax=Fulvivirga sediminis TaxID=2803949 RepID=A0A937JZ30_9BACT|nr:lanthionine synthetase LanC family protein [Fulvivirga sediminis]MBL3657008.1 hypothetical protein [Fulvivirga sediminis]
MKDKEYLKASITIADGLLDKAEVSEGGIFWETLSMLNNKDVEFQGSESLYSGNSGIIYFFLKMYEETAFARYKEALIKGVDWLLGYCYRHPTSYYSFFTGRVGVAFTLIEVGKSLKDPDYSKEALRLIEGCEMFLEEKPIIDDLINGISGTLLGLLHIHAATNNDLVLEKIKIYVQYLVNRINIDENGFYWDRNTKASKGLCGFSHGVAGVAYVFLELGRYFKNETFYYIAAEAFAYENYHFKQEINNWPDLRNGFYDKESFKIQKEEYLNGNKDFFFQEKDMVAWCHGAPGVGLSRIKACQVLEKTDYLRDLNIAVNKTIDSLEKLNALPGCFVLCHGGGGNALFLMEVDRYNNTNEHYPLVKKIADSSIDSYNRYGYYNSGYAFAKDNTDNSLFMGDAGIGYFYLLVSQGRLRNPSILKPELSKVYDKKIEGVLSLTKNQLFDRLVKKCFPLSGSYIIHHVKPDFKISFLKYVTDELALISCDLDASLKSKLSYELLKKNMDRTERSDAYRHLKAVVEIENNRSILQRKEDLKSAILKVPHDYMLVDYPKLGLEEGDYVLLAPGPFGVREYFLDDFSYVIIKNFLQPSKIEFVIKNVANLFEVNSENQRQEVENTTLDQIKQCLLSGMLVEER